jgi:hypothetical protein
MYCITVNGARQNVIEVQVDDRDIFENNFNITNVLTRLEQVYFIPEVNFVILHKLVHKLALRREQEKLSDMH